jgi:hypothetical protein
VTRSLAKHTTRRKGRRRGRCGKSVVAGAAGEKGCMPPSQAA